MPKRETVTVAENAVTKIKLPDPPDEAPGSVPMGGGGDVQLLAGERNRVKDKNIDQLNDKIARM